MVNPAALYKTDGFISDRGRAMSASKVSVVFPESSKILKRIAERDRNAIDECLSAYGNLVWSLTKKYVETEDEAEIAAQEIFLDIWKYAENFDEAKTDEATFVSHIAVRKLMKRNQTPVV